MNLLDEVEKRCAALGWAGRFRDLPSLLPVRFALVVIQEVYDELRAQQTADRQNFQRQIDRLASRP